MEQTGQARFLFLTVPIAVTLESTERPPDVVEVRRVKVRDRAPAERLVIVPMPR